MRSWSATVLRQRLSQTNPGAAALILLALLSSACAGAQRESGHAAWPAVQSAAQSPVGPWAGLPPVPPDKAPASTDVALLQDGNDYAGRDALGSTIEEGTFLNFSPPDEELAWAMYSFYVGSHVTSSLSVKPQPGDRGIYIGYSDYTSGRWEFSGPYNIPAQPQPAAEITVPIEASALSPQGNMHVVVAVSGEAAAAVIEELRIDVVNWEDGQMSLSAQDAFSFSLAQVGNRPAIAYVDFNQELFFVRASVADGSSWEAPVPVGSGPFGALRSVSLAVVDGRPAIAVQRGGAGGSLEFFRALDASGANWPVSADTVDSSASDSYFGSDPSMISINGYTAIAFRAEDSTLGYAVNNEDASDQWFTLLVDDTNNGSGFPMLKEINGHPAICYIYFPPGIGSDEELNYAYSTSLSGINVQDWEIVKVDDTFSAFGSGWLQLEWVDDSFPAIFYREGSGSKFRYARALTPDGLGGWDKKVIDPTEGGNIGCGLLIDNGHPAVVYRTAENTCFMRALDPEGINWAAPINIAPASTGGTCAAVIGGQPAVATTANFEPSILAYIFRP